LSRSTSKILIVPARFFTRPSMARNSTDLPAPDAPTKPRISPRLMSRSRWSRITLSPKATVTSRADRMISDAPAPPSGGAGRSLVISAVSLIARS